jgi:TonB family protein
LNTKDFAQLRAALARRRSGAGQLHSIVGYFRSHNRDDLFLSADDLSVIRTCFRDPDSAFLVIKVLPAKTCTAGFFFWNNGEIQSEYTDSEVPLIPLGHPAPAPDELLASRSLERTQSQATGWRRRWVNAGCAICAVAAAALIAVVGDHEKKQPAAPAQIVSTPRPVETGFVGPEIVHQVAPAIPSGIGRKIKTPVQIDVTVNIDEAGKVIGARVTSSSGAAGLLSPETLKAAHLFRFRPATESNRPVRSDMVLTFRFAPKD